MDLHRGLLLAKRKKTIRLSSPVVDKILSNL
jgi:hypothetical protein